MPAKRCDRGAVCGRVASRSGLCSEHWIELFLMARIQLDWVRLLHTAESPLVQAASKASACPQPPTRSVTARLDFSRLEGM